MRIRVDPDLCEGYGVCMQLKPEWFRLGEDVPVQVLVARLDPSLRRELQDVVEHCPRNAIKILSDDD
jgi:ferredoxin